MTELDPEGMPAKPAAKVNFNSLAATYDELRFLRLCAGRLAERAAIPPGARVLDVATGTGTVAFEAAAMTGPEGRVVGVDRAQRMVARARQKLAAAGLPHVEFREGDAQQLEFPDGSFDLVLCASSLFFMPDMPGAVREWRRVLVPGGRAGFSSFGVNFLQPLRALWRSCLERHGLTLPPLPSHRLEDPATHRDLLGEAGFTGIEVEREQLGYHVRSAEDRWGDIWAGPEGKPLLALSEEQQEAIRVEHLKELSGLATDRGLWIDLPVIFAFGRRPAEPLGRTSPETCRPTRGRTGDNPE